MLMGGGRREGLRVVNGVKSGSCGEVVPRRRKTMGECEGFPKKNSE